MCVDLVKANRLIFRILFPGLLLFVIATTFAEELQLVSGVKGIWMAPGESEDPDFEWKAHWIWDEEEQMTSMLLARKSFDLSSIPEKAKLRISASSIHKLYINGSYVLKGPARCAPHHQSYDILDISDLLQVGENLIAVRVHHQEGKYSYQHKGRAGLLAQLDLGSNDQLTTIITDGSWKVSPDPSWESEEQMISRFQQIVVDKVDLRKAMSRWADVEFDDSNWTNAVSLMRKIGWPSPQPNANPQALTPPWTSLVPRDLPYLLETEINADKIIQSTSIEKSDLDIFKDGWQVEPIQLDLKVERDVKKAMGDYAKGKSLSLICSKDNIRFLLFDFGTVINGYPQLKVKGEAGMKIDLLYAPFVVEDSFTSNIVDSNMHDQIILTGNDDAWEATYFKPTRYLGILIHGREGEIELKHVGIRQITYPFQRVGKMYSNDAPWVEAYFNASAKTIDVCTTDGYTDNYRERRQYAQTGYYAALGNYYTFGDIALQRRYLIQSAQEQKPNGIMPAYAPSASDDFMVIMDSNCLWIRSLRNYLLYSGDFKTAETLLPNARLLMQLLDSYTNTLGMIDNPPFAYWMDHALNDRRGANTTLNGHYLGALEDFAQVLQWLDQPEFEIYQERANLLRTSLRSNLWDDEKQLFADALVDDTKSEMFSEHANAMALALGFANEEQGQLIAGQLLLKDEHNYIKRTSGMTMVTPAMSYFLHKGLCEHGFIDESFEMFRGRFDKMLQPGTNGTLWEEWWLDAIGRSGKLQKGRTRSDAQTESAFPPALFPEYLLGLKVAKPGMKEVTLKKQDHGLNHVAGSIPSPLGILDIEWKLEGEEKELIVKVPDGMSLRLDLESLQLEDDTSITMNGKADEIDIDQDPYMSISEGRTILTFK